MTSSGRTSAPRSYDAPGRDRVLAAVRDLDGHADVTSAVVARRVGLSRRTVRGHLAELERLGWIERNPIRPIVRREAS